MCLALHLSENPDSASLPLASLQGLFNTVLTQISSTDLTSISRCHKRVSAAVGKGVGVWEGKQVESPTDPVEDLVETLRDGSYQQFVEYGHFVRNDWAGIVQSFLRTKDEGLIRLVCAVLFEVAASGADLGILTKAGIRKRTQEEEKQVEGYSEEVVSRLVALLATDPAFGVSTFKFIANVLYDLTYHSELKECLNPKDYKALIEAYAIIINNIKGTLFKSNMFLCFFEIFKAQWDDFQFWDLAQFKKIAKSPSSLLPLNNEESKNHMPDYVMEKTNSQFVKNLKEALERFFILTHLVHKLHRFEHQSPFDEYPFKTQGRDIHTWEEGDVVVVEDQETLVSCYQKTGKVSVTKYILADEEYFLLAEPDADEGPLKTVKIKVKTSWKNVHISNESFEKQINLVLYEFDSNGECKYSDLSLFFESSPNTKQVLRLLQDRRESQIECLNVLILSFFDQWYNDVILG